MKSLLHHLWSRLFASATPQARPSERPELRRAADSATTANPVAKAPARVALQSLGARRPLISSDGHIVGFEFHVAEHTSRRLAHREDHHAQAAHASAVLASARLIGQTGKIGFARVPATWLLLGADAQAGPGMMVGLEQDDEADQTPDVLHATEQTVRRLRDAGAKVGWAAPGQIDAVPDFLMLHQRSMPMAELLQSLQRLPKTWAAVPVLVTDIANLEDLELALQHGVRWGCGAPTSRSATQDSDKNLPVSPEVRRIGHLLHQLVTGAETTDIVAEVKGDVGLSYRLLRRINSASFAQLGPGTTIEQAAMILGRNELYRWFSMLLIQFAGQRKTSSALQEIALWRSRLMELLAQEHNDTAAGQMFTLGLASMLGLMLGTSAAEIISALNLPEPARQALLEQTGPWYGYLKTATELEHPSQIEPGPGLELPGGRARLLELSDQAWTWAADNSHRDA